MESSREQDPRKEHSKESTLSKLRRYAETLDYDDECGGEAIRAYREELRELALEVEPLEDYGFTAHLSEYRPEKDGYIEVEIRRKENPDEKFSIYYQSLETFPEGFPRQFQQYHEQVMEKMKDRGALIRKVACMFGVKPTESTSA